MAYTKYTGGNQKLDDELKKYGAQYQEARAKGDWEGMQAANNAANQLRNQYGYSAEHATDDINLIRGQSQRGGSSGGGSSGGGFSYESAPEYTSRYQDLIDQVSGQILNRPEFTYDPESDPLYRQYREQYTQAGERAMEDTLGQVSARTGGLASSYATTASQQAYNQYMGALADKVPELRQLAYEMYRQEGDDLTSRLNMLLALEQGDYGRYQDLLNQYNADRNFSYGAYRDQVSDQRYDQEWQYQVGRDQIADQRYEEERQYQRDSERAALLAQSGNFSGYADLWGLSDAETQALVDLYAEQKRVSDQQAAMDLAAFYAQYGDFSQLRQMGVDTSYLDQVQRAELSGLYAQPSGGSSGASSSSGGRSASSSGGSRGDEPSWDVNSRMYQNGIASEGDAYAWLLASGYSSTEAENLASYYMEWLNSGAAEQEEEENATIDWGSAQALGYGPVSAERLAELEAAGEIESYISGGMRRFRKTDKAGKTQSGANRQTWFDSAMGTFLGGR